MRVLTNELKYAKILRQKGFNPAQAESIISMLSEMEIHNVYSKSEIDIMLSETVERVFAKQDERLREQQREFDEKMAIYRDESREFRKDQRLDFQNRFTQFHEEIKSSRRWLIGTVITVGMGLAAYLSAIIKLS